MPKGSDNPYPSVLFEEQGSTPSTPATGFWRVYTKSDGLYIVDDAGATTGPFGAGGAGAYSGVPWSSGTAMPGGPSTNDRVTRTDLGLDFYYDGGQWVTVTKYQGFVSFGVLPDGLVTSPKFAMLGPGPMAGLGWYVYTIDIGSRVITTNDGSKYWTVTCYKADATTETSLGNFTTASDTLDVRTTHTLTVNAAVASGTEWLEFIAAKTSTPGGLYLAATVNYRLIGT